MKLLRQVQWWLHRSYFWNTIILKQVSCVVLNKIQVAGDTFVSSSWALFMQSCKSTLEINTWLHHGHVLVLARAVRWGPGMCISNIIIVPSSDAQNKRLSMLMQTSTVDVANTFTSWNSPVAWRPTLHIIITSSTCNTKATCVSIYICLAFGRWIFVHRKVLQYPILTLQARNFNTNFTCTVRSCQGESLPDARSCLWEDTDKHEELHAPCLQLSGYLLRIV